MGLNPEREYIMNVANYPLMGFKEFEAYQTQLSRPSFPNWNRGVQDGTESTTAKTPALSSMRDSIPVQRLMSGLQLDNSRAITGHKPYHRGHHGRARGHEENSANSSSMQLDSRSFQKSLQSTELTIQTKDGDTVTIKIREQSVEKGRSKVEISQDGSGNGKNSATVVQKSKSDSAESFDLNALFEDGAVSDVSFGKEWVSRSSDKVKVESTSDGITTEASYQSKTYTAGSLEFEVDGSLDADELEAIADLLQGVDELSQTFFDGDMTKAFDQALQLGYDKSEIAGYALELRDQELSVEQTKYRASAEIARPRPHRGMFRPIGDYASKLQSLETLDQTKFDGQLLNRLMEQVDANREIAEEAKAKEAPSSFTSFNFELLQQMQVLNFSATMS